MKHAFLTLLLFLSTVITSLTAAAETAYITDVLYVQLRSSPCSNCKIIRGLRSGSSLEVINIDEDAGFTEVRTGRGDTGWIPTQYIVREKTAAEKLKDVSRELASLKVTHADAAVHWKA